MEDVVSNLKMFQYVFPFSPTLLFFDAGHSSKGTPTECPANQKTIVTNND